MWAILDSEQQRRFGRARAFALGAGAVASLVLAGVPMRPGAAARAKPTPVPHLHDVTRDSGLPTLGLTSGAVLVDLDGDGKRDLLLGRHHDVPEAYRNLGDCRFAAMPGWGSGLRAWDQHATLADDLDGDGLTDLYFVVGADKGEGVKSNTLALGKDDYATDVAPAWGVHDPFGRARGTLLLDVDGDGGRDLLVLNFRTAMRAYQLDAPSPKPDRVSQLFGVQAANDSVTAAVAASGESSSSIRTRYDYVTRLYPYDLDDDGRADYVACAYQTIQLMRFQGGVVRTQSEGFAREINNPPPVAAAWGDFDGNGAVELFLAAGADEFTGNRDAHSRLLAWHDGAFKERPSAVLASARTAVECAAADIDNDGALDLIVLESTIGRMLVQARVFLNAGDGTFVAPAEPGLVSGEEPGIGEGLLIADFDDDGDLDVLLLMGGMEWEQREVCGGVRLYRNDLRGAHWLNVALEAAPGRVPYGARVDVTYGKHTQSRQYWPHQVSGSAFADPVHFGLGPARHIDRVTVHWPTGEQTVRTDVQVDSSVVVRIP